MKRIIAFFLCLMMMSLAACGGNETAGQSNDTSAQAGTAGTAEDTLEASETTLSIDNSETTLSTDNSEATETTETVMEAVPVPENIAVTNTTDRTDEQVTEFSGDAVYQDVVDYAALLEAMGFTISEEFRNDGIYRVNATKDNVAIYTGFAHGTRDDKFLDKIAQGEEVKGTFSGRITVAK